VSPLVSAAEVRFREECHCAGGVVRLGDVAEIIAADPQEAAALAQIELFPAPPPGEKRFVRAQQIQDQLLLSQINLAHHRLSGASHMVLYGAAPAQAAAIEGPRTVSTGELNRAVDVVRRAIVRHLKHQPGPEQAWTVTPTIDQSQARSILTAKGEVTASGGSAPWVGTQQFALVCQTPNGTAEFPVSAEVSLPPAVVVAVRTVPRGAIVQPSDVELRPGASSITPGAIGSVAEAVGLEATRVLFAGQVLDSQAIRRPVLVHRGEVVTLYARAAGVQVRTTGRARDDGSLGTLVEVESLLDKSIVFARVSGPQEVEVYAPPAALTQTNN
ncbi:MAG: flagellar basal body P-ring formation protein FlgA, partial [Planctomycetes bacterium]|nr:flagellar basal body P-ring formation protein FlgA [Planctomycetota bacterium]